MKDNKESILVKLKDEVFDIGFDTILAFISLGIIGSNKATIFGLIMLYIVLRSFFIKNPLFIVLINIFVIYGILLVSSTSIKANHIFTYIIVLIVLLLITIIQISRILLLSLSRETVKQEQSTNKIKNTVLKVIYLFEKSFNSMKFLMALICIAILIGTFILTFASMYNTINGIYVTKNESAGYYNVVGNSDNITRLSYIENFNPIEIFDYIKKLHEEGYIYFSSVTYFTIGYGDFIPKGDIARLITIIQMVIAQILNLTVFALFTSLFSSYIRIPS